MRSTNPRGRIERSGTFSLRATAETTTTGAQIPNGTTAYTRFYTGKLKFDAANNSLVPDYGSGQPNLQTIWLELTLAEARRDPSVDMIVVFMHQVPLSTSATGNGSEDWGGDRNGGDDRKECDPLTCSPWVDRTNAAGVIGRVSFDSAQHRIDGTLRWVLAFAATALAARHESLPVPGCRRTIDILGPRERNQRGVASGKGPANARLGLCIFGTFRNGARARGDCFLGCIRAARKRIVVRFLNRHWPK